MRASSEHTHTHTLSSPMFQLISAQHHPTTQKLEKCLDSHGSQPWETKSKRNIFSKQTFLDVQGIARKKHQKKERQPRHNHTMISHSPG